MTVVEEQDVLRIRRELRISADLLANELARSGRRVDEVDVVALVAPHALDRVSLRARGERDASVVRHADRGHRVIGEPNELLRGEIVDRLERSQAIAARFDLLLRLEAWIFPG